jgi:hypothetical protein
LAAVSGGGQVVVSHANAAWLPAGSRADVVLAAGHVVAPPSPVCLVRLLATRDGRVLTGARPDGAGLDIPTLRVVDGTAEAGLQALVTQTLGRAHPTTLLGYVRNVVPDPSDDYPWPSPEAHFAVWTCEVPPGVDPDGVWLDASEAKAHLADRHWWPLAAHAFSSATTC